MQSSKLIALTVYESVTVGMQHMKEDFFEHFKSEMAPYIARVQPSNDAGSSGPTLQHVNMSVEDFGEELCDAVSKLSLYKVRFNDFERLKASLY